MLSRYLAGSSLRLPGIYCRKISEKCVVRISIGGITGDTIYCWGDISFHAFFCTMYLHNKYVSPRFSSFRQISFYPWK